MNEKAITVTYVRKNDKFLFEVDRDVHDPPVIICLTSEEARELFADMHGLLDCDGYHDD